MEKSKAIAFFVHFFILLSCLKNGQKSKAMALTFRPFFDTF